MQIRTIQTTNRITFDEEVNEFMRTHTVKATQTHINTVISNGVYEEIYTAIIYYEKNGV